jgi:PAS domain S-box-containing protein
VVAPRQPSADALLESISDVVAVIDAQGVLTYASPSAERMLGYSPADRIGRKILDLVHPHDAELVATELARAATAPGISGAFQFRVRTASGEWATLETTANNRLDDPATRGVVISARDITDRHQFESAWRFVSASSQALIRAVDERSLLEQMCRVAVEEGGYVFAWVGYADTGPERRVVPVARFGDDAGYLDAITVTWDDSATGRGPVGSAIRTGDIQVIADASTSPAFVPWQRQASAVGFRSVIGLPLAFPGHPCGALAIYADERDAFDPDAVGMLRGLAADLAYGIGRLRDAHRLEGLLDQTIGAVAAMVEQRDLYTAGHQRRVAELSAAISTALGLDEATIHGIRTAAGLHDLGKIAVPTEILSKPGRFTPAEFELVKGHVQAGYDIVSKIDFPWPVADMILQHHERLDGSGYPNGLHGAEISLGARIIAVADVVEAMASHRPYRVGLGIDAALAEVTANRDTLFDPDVVNTCVRLFASGAFTFDMSAT